MNALAPGSDVPARLRDTIWQRIWGASFLYRLLLAVAEALGKTGLSPDVITLGSLAVSVAATGCIVYGHFLISSVLLVVAGTLDLLDGAVARTSGQSSRWGALLDSTVDRIADALPLAGLVVLYTAHVKAQLVLLVSIVLSFTISYVRARAESLDVTLPSVFMRRAERLFLLVICLVLGSFEFPVLDATLQVPHGTLFIGLCISTLLNAIGCMAVLTVARRKMGIPTARTSRPRGEPPLTSSQLHPTRG